MRPRRGRLPLLSILVGVGITLAACAGPAATPAPTEAPSMPMEPTMEPEHADEAAPTMVMEGTGEMDEHAHAEIPSEYEGLTNAYTGDAAAIAEGKQIYDTQCAACHGSGGAGDGPAASVLTPPPADFGDADMMQTTTDAYLFWRVSDGGGGEPFNSAMPAWKATLAEDEIWKVIAYVRTFSGN